MRWFLVSKLLQYFRKVLRKVQWHAPSQEVLEVDFCFAKFSGSLLQAGSRHIIGHCKSPVLGGRALQKKAHQLPGSSDEPEDVFPRFTLQRLQQETASRLFGGSGQSRALRRPLISSGLADLSTCVTAKIKQNSPEDALHCVSDMMLTPEFEVASSSAGVDGKPIRTPLSSPAAGLSCRPSARM